MNSGPKIRTLLWKANKAMETLDRASIAATGLGLTDFAVLEVLLNKGPLPVNRIGKKVLLTSGSITTAIHRLETRGLVFRRKDASDARVSVVHLTDRGEQLIRDAYKRHREHLESATGDLTPGEQAELARLLKKLGFHAQALADALAE